jgi:hypothetical protein
MPTMNGSATEPTPETTQETARPTLVMPVPGAIFTGWGPRNPHTSGSGIRWN